MKPLIRTLLLAGIVLFFALPHHSGLALRGSFVLAAATIIVLPWALFAIVRIAVRPAERRARAISLAIWTVTLVVSFAAKAYWDAAARKEAGAVAAAVHAHRSNTGSYPAGLAELGIDAPALEEKLGLRYAVDEGKARLSYSRPSMPLVAHHYDFETGTWKSAD